MCTELVRPLKGDEIVTAMVFVGEELVVGTGTGRVLVVSASIAHRYTGGCVCVCGIPALHNRLDKQREVYPRLLQDSRVDHLHSNPVALPAVVSSLYLHTCHAFLCG